MTCCGSCSTGEASRFILITRSADGSGGTTKEAIGLPSHVVPANAGTHNHRCSLGKKPSASVPEDRPRRMGPCVRRDDEWRDPILKHPDTRQRIPATRRARVMLKFFPPSIKGAGKAGSRLHPWVPCNKKHGGRTTGSTGIPPAFPAQWFYGFLRALLGDRALLPPSPVKLPSPT